MQLISTEDVVKSVNLQKFGGENMARIIMSLLQIDKINNIYANHSEKQAPEFLQSILTEIGINYEIPNDDLAKIPKQGPFVIIANHPFGGIEGLILLKSLLPIRPDFKIIANFLFQRIEPIRDLFFAVNPFETHPHVKSSYSGLRQGLTHLENGHPLAIFPAGEVSAYQKGYKEITDRVWRTSILKFISSAKVPVFPVYFYGKNSQAFYFMGRIHPLLRTVKIPSEMLNKKNVRVTLAIGNPITVKEQNIYQDINAYGQHLRSKTYALASLSERKQKLISKIKNKGLLIHEIDKLNVKFLLFKWEDYSVFCAPTILIPNIIREIGRLREIAFREVGEGTNRGMDLDKFDRYYHQLFIWNQTEKEIVGGYRLGKGFEILPERGMEGFYINTLFQFGSKMESILNQSLELGRSFIVKKYQRKPLSLFLLWKGIFYFLKNNIQCRYLIGPVSISNDYSKVSKQVMAEYIQKNHFNYDISSWIQPKTPYAFSFESKEISENFGTAIDFKSLDQLIKDIEGLDKKMPVLLKKYLSIGGKIAGFNVDPKFNNCLDCLLLLDLKDVPENMITSFSK